MDGNDARRTDRLEAVLRAAHARRGAPPVDAGLADSVLAAIKAGPVAAQPYADEQAKARIDRLERVLRTAQARRSPPPLDPDMAASVLAAIQAPAAAQPDQETGLLWRMAAGAGLLAAATVLFALTFGSGLEGELGRLLFFDPSGQVLVSLLGV